MLLGGMRYLVPVIDAAHGLGAHVITADYLPDNAAHRHSDEYCNVSVMDRESVLEAAMARQVDGIMSFACDPGVVAAAYVAEKMGLPFQCSYEAACILQNKGRYRRFLAENGFNGPRAKTYSSRRQAVDDLCRGDIEKSLPHFPVFVKPVDSAGAKGCSRVDAPEQFPAAVDAALANAHSGEFIVEDFIEFEGSHSSADVFAIDGRIVSVSYSDEIYDVSSANRYIPFGTIWPSTMRPEHQAALTGDLQRLFDLLGVRTGLFNVDSAVGRGGIPYLMEVSPRGGGNRLAELQEMAYGVNLLENEVRRALSLPLNLADGHDIRGAWCSMMVHASGSEGGRYGGLRIREDIRRHLRLEDIVLKQGDPVPPFTGANASLGNLILQFPSREELDAAIRDMSAWLEILR